jgi:hypothetical protein
MKIWSVIFFSAVGVVCVSCKHTDSADEDARYQAWCLSAIKAQAVSHQSAVLVLIDECHVPRPERVLDFSGTVVRSYKGSWKPGEQIAWYRGLEFIPDKLPPLVGKLEIILTDEHTNGLIYCEPGVEWDYQPDFDRALRLIYFTEAKQ